jgi:hypothetical protein
VVPIADKEHPIGEKLQVRVSSQLGFELTISSSLMRAPAPSIHITYRTLFSMLVANRNIKQKSTGPVFVDKLSLQPLDVIYKSGSNKRHIHHST